MAYQIECPSCGQILDIPDGYDQTLLTCPSCNKSFSLGGGSGRSSVDSSGGQWHLFVGGSQRHGPLGEDIVIEWIKQGKVGPEDLVWCVGMRTWAPCSTTPPFCAHVPRNA